MNEHFRFCCTFMVGLCVEMFLLLCLEERGNNSCNFNAHNIFYFSHEAKRICEKYVFTFPPGFMGRMNGFKRTHFVSDFRLQSAIKEMSVLSSHTVTLIYVQNLGQFSLNGNALLWHIFFE